MGPFEVFKKTTKTFTLCLATREEVAFEYLLMAHTAEAAVKPQEAPARGLPRETSTPNASLPLLAVEDRVICGGRCNVHIWMGRKSPTLLYEKSADHFL
jgi:hypothetical protein